MVVLRHDGELTLIDPIRLTPEGEAELKALGEVKRILRLGAMHGIDDPWYVDQFGAELWSQPGGTVYTTPAIDVEINATTEPAVSRRHLVRVSGHQRTGRRDPDRRRGCQPRTAADLRRRAALR